MIMAYRKLVVNGCSYMEAYASGQGHEDLAARLNIPIAESLAIGGSANSRILRTTVKHSYQSDCPTVYVLGMTFLSRLEIPILENQTEFEGRWTNPQNQKFKQHWQYGWTEQETQQFIDIKLKSEIYSILDRIEDLMYRMLSTVSDLRSRGHLVLMYQQADDLYQNLLEHPRLKLFKTVPNIIDGYAWRAVPWQLNCGVPTMPGNQTPIKIRHPASGYHQTLNEFLVHYIHSRNMLT
jgi:hypothetical protein